MNWENEGFILSKRKFRENAIILEVFTSDFGKVNGIVYGGTSRKVKNYLQLTNKIYLNYVSKSDNRIGYFKTELIEAFAPRYFNNKNRILCLNSITSILRILLPENQKSKNIYNSLENLLSHFDNKDWFLNYLYWELNLISNLGFGFDTDKISNTNGQKNINIKIDNIDYKIPIFLISKDNVNINSNEIYEGLLFTRKLMENKFFIPNNIKFPLSRKIFENKFLEIN
jgi:DNA repair protein RecO